MILVSAFLFAEPKKFQSLKNLVEPLTPNCHYINDTAHIFKFTRDPANKIAYKSVITYSKPSKPKRIFFPLHSMANETVSYVRDGYVYAYCEEPEEDILDATDVGIVHFDPTIESGFAGGIRSGMKYWLVLSDTVYSSGWKRISNISGTFPPDMEFIYMNTQIDGTMVYINDEFSILNCLKHIPGNEAMRMPVDLKQTVVLDTDIPHSPVPLIIGEDKFSVAMLLCTEDRSSCNFETAPQVI